MTERRRSIGGSNRPVETQAATDFLASARGEPAALLVEGEPGIGKTTLWLNTVEQARKQGFQVLSARAVAGESGLAYSLLADLLRGVSAAVFDQLPDPQKLAVDQILLRANQHGAATDQHAVSAAFLSVAQMLGETSPLLIAIDDLQWVDQSSRQVVAFATRRLSTGMGMLCTLRAGEESDHTPSSWLQLSMPDRLTRIRLGPLSLGALHTVVSQRLERSLPRPTMVRIFEVSGGNPFYAIEIAREIDGHSPVGELSLPATLSEVVQSRLDGLKHDVQEALLAIACLRSATTEVVGRAVDLEPDHLVALLEQAEAQGIIEIAGNRLQFAHPLLARGIYDRATPARRRKMHHRLADVVDQPEARARHLALGSTRGDATTLQALDTAAASAHSRGAPTAAAELLELAMRLGGDSPILRIRTAAYHFDAGDPARARSLLEEAVTQLPAGGPRADALHLLALVRLYDDSFTEAANLIGRGLEEAPDNPGLRIQMLITLALASVNAGGVPKAVRIAEEAVSNAFDLGEPGLLSLALGMRTILRFQRGDGFDENDMRQALRSDDHNATLPLALSPRWQNALLLDWTGQLDIADRQMLSIRRECIERGQESQLIIIGFFVVLHAIWRGDVTDAALIAEDTAARSLQLGGDFPTFIGLTVRGLVAVYSGREDDARRDIADALAAGQRCSAHTMMQWTIGTLAFLEVSLGNYQAAVTTLEPLVSELEAAPDCTEIIHASFVPDAIESLVHLGRTAEAESLIDLLQRNGERLDRAWMLAVAARSRGILLAAAGDPVAATRCAHQALTQHDRLAMPFERARTQLLLGQLEHRQRRRGAAAATLQEALATFERFDASLWAARARASLARNDAHPTRPSVLTPSERRVAELAASGMTNREVAAALFVSVKTVEVNLTRIYRKFGIRSRTELGRRIDRLDT
jgi:ATP/maltotriose-dependent transcriptional regulator MalT